MKQIDCLTRNNDFLKHNHNDMFEILFGREDESISKISQKLRKGGACELVPGPFLRQKLYYNGAKS